MAPTSCALALRFPAGERPARSLLPLTFSQGSSRTLGPAGHSKRTCPLPYRLCSLCLRETGRGFVVGGPGAGPPQVGHCCAPGRGCGHARGAAWADWSGAALPSCWDGCGVQVSPQTCSSRGLHPGPWSPPKPAGSCLQAHLLRTHGTGAHFRVGFL